MTEFQFAMAIVIWFALAVIVAAVADARGSNGSLYFFLSLVLSPLIAFIVLIALPSSDVIPEGQAKCPHCHGLVDMNVSCCMHCRREIIWPEEPTPKKLSRDEEASKFKLQTECPTCGRIIMLGPNGIPTECSYCESLNGLKHKEMPNESFEATCPDCGRAFPVLANRGIVEMLCPHCQSILKLDTVPA